MECFYIGWLRCWVSCDARCMGNLKTTTTHERDAPDLPHWFNSQRLRSARYMRAEGPPTLGTKISYSATAFVKLPARGFGLLLIPKLYSTVMFRVKWRWFALRFQDIFNTLIQVCFLSVFKIKLHSLEQSLKVVIIKPIAFKIDQFKSERGFAPTTCENRTNFILDPIEKRTSILISLNWLQTNV